MDARQERGLVYIAGKGANGERLEAIMMALASDEKRGAKPETQYSDAPAPKPRGEAAAEPAPVAATEPAVESSEGAQPVAPELEPGERSPLAQVMGENAVVVDRTAVEIDTATIIERRNAGVAWSTLAAGAGCPVSTLRNRVRRFLTAGSVAAVESVA